MRRIVLKLLVGYKKYISRGENCRFIPSCSEYTYEAVKKYGTVKGLVLGIARIWRCRPGGKSGIDLLK
ncbi:MAG TPA: membrane protein insertion efficiency factor YidD [Candidatus Woesebacteria bacterium]|nr:membrane protein insertion efficiency factor YidD [Candidatus Shapirobacteria bacterium]HOR01983.1 membrane protein insertion efficiency factor YidD [Candidatus Woesebacteria bacterium]